MWVAVVGDINIASMLVDRAAIAVVCQHNAREMRIPLALAALLLYGISRFEPSASPTAKPPEDASLVSPMHHNVTDTSQFPMLRQLSSSAPPSAIPSPPPMPPPSAISSRPQMQVVVAEFYFDHAGELTYLTDAGQKATCDAVATGAAVAHGDIECIYFASESAHRLRHLLRATISAPAGSTVSAIKSSLEANLGTTAASLTVLGLPVTLPPTVSIKVVPAPPPCPLRSSQSSSGCCDPLCLVGAIGSGIGGCIGGLLCLMLCLGGIIAIGVNHLMVEKKGAPSRASNADVASKYAGRSIT